MTRLDATGRLLYTSSLAMSSNHDTHSQRGLFIVIEGLDRCGKSTQVERLVARLQASGRPARLQKFPGVVKERFAYQEFLTSQTARRPSAK